MNNVFLGRLTLQDSNSYGGSKYVFVKTKGQKNSWRPLLGGIVMNAPTGGNQKMFQGDLVEYQTDGKNGRIYLLKTYEVNANVAADGVAIQIKRDEYRHIPEVGEVLMKATNTLNGTGAGYAITAIDSTHSDYWIVTLGTTIGALSAGDVLVQAKAAGAAVQMMVTNPNAFMDIDSIFKMPTTNADNNAIYTYTPIMHEIAWISRMAKLPACILALNKSNVKDTEGNDIWFEI